MNESIHFRGWLGNLDLHFARLVAPSAFAWLLPLLRLGNHPGALPPQRGLLVPRPFAWYQLIAWILLFASFIPFGFGVHSLRSRGKPVDKREGDPSLLAFEKTTQLVTTGIYHYIRHPLYSSLFLLAWGIFFKLPSLVGGILVVVATVFLGLTAKADEAECTKFLLARQTDGAAVQLPPKPSGYPSALAR